MKMPSVLRILLAATALRLITPAISSAQTDRPSTADATRRVQDSLLTQRERDQWEALKTRDTSTFARLMGGGLVDVDASGIKRTSAASTARYVMGCKVSSYDLSDVRIAHFGGTAVITYKSAVDATCWGQKAPSPLYVMTVYDQHGEAWRPVAHSETPAAHW